MTQQSIYPREIMHPPKDMCKNVQSSFTVKQLIVKANKKYTGQGGCKFPLLPQRWGWYNRVQVLFGRKVQFFVHLNFYSIVVVRNISF